MTTIHTIGIGNQSIQNFISNLQINQIQAVIDIRSKPYSRYLPDFNKVKLEQHLVTNKIGYRFLGQELGGIPKDPKILTNELPDYEKIRKTILYQQGLDYLEKGLEFNCRMALLCACSDYTKCHRLNLVGVDLEHLGYELIHILRNGSTSQEMRLF